MQTSRRHIISALLTALYLLVILSPLAPLAMHSKHIAHAITGECGGDCSICGCAPERSATRSCCCWQKRLAEAHAVSGATCASSRPTAAANCCAPHKQKAARDQLAASTAGETDPAHGARSTIGVLPCGSGKLVALWGTEQIHHLPSRFSSQAMPPLEGLIVQARPADLISRYIDPPDPPPKPVRTA